MMPKELARHVNRHCELFYNKNDESYAEIPSEVNETHTKLIIQQCKVIIDKMNLGQYFDCSGEEENESFATADQTIDEIGNSETTRKGNCCDPKCISSHLELNHRCYHCNDWLHNKPCGTKVKGHQDTYICSQCITLLKSQSETKRRMVNRPSQNRENGSCCMGEECKDPTLDLCPIHRCPVCEEIVHIICGQFGHKSDKYICNKCFKHEKVRKANLQDDNELPDDKEQAINDKLPEENEETIVTKEPEENEQTIGAKETIGDKESEGNEETIGVKESEGNEEIIGAKESEGNEKTENKNEVSEDHSYFKHLGNQYIVQMQQDTGQYYFEKGNSKFYIRKKDHDKITGNKRKPSNDEQTGTRRSTRKREKTEVMSL